MRSLSRWSYARSADNVSRRDLRLDLLRGFCVFVMVADHIGGERSWLYVITSGNRFFASAAEGFVLISGITMGAVYLSVIHREGLGAMLRKVLRRAGFLYLMTVTLTIAFANVSRLFDTFWSRTTTPAPPIEWAIGVGTLHRSYPLTDVMLMYTLLVFVAPPLLYLLATNRVWMVLAGSWALWLLWQISPDEVQFPWDVKDGGFPFAAWQVLFANGIVIGWYRGRIARALPIAARTAIVAVGSLLAILLIAGFQLAISDRAGTEPSGLAWLLSSDLVFGKHDLRPGRLIAMAGVATFAYTLVTVWWGPIRRALGWLLLPLGERALGAYGLHLFVVALAWSVIGDPLRSGGEHTLIQVLGIAAIWALLPLLPWLGEVEHLASRAAPLIHPLGRFVGLRPIPADTA